MKTDAEKLRSIRLFLFDMDGTLYLGNRVFSFTKDLLRSIRKSGKQYMFMTNNSSISVKDYIRKLAKMGITSDAQDYITSSQATAQFLQEKYPGNRLYVVGTESLKQELREKGFDVVDSVQKTQCIVMGFDTELTFQKLWDVSYLLNTRPDIPYIATNPDYVCPTEFGSVPDCGSVCDMLYNATGKRPVIIGKPSPYMVELAMKQVKATPEETAVIGDRIYTDVLCGQRAHATGVLVMTGETTQKILDSSRDKPDIILKSAGEIAPFCNGNIKNM